MSVKVQNCHCSCLSVLFIPQQTDTVLKSTDTERFQDGRAPVMEVSCPDYVWRSPQGLRKLARVCTPPVAGLMLVKSLSF